MELKLKKQPQKYLASVGAPIRKKFYRALNNLSRLEGDIVPPKGYANRYRYKILHYRITSKWVKGEIVITVIEINARTNIKCQGGFLMNQPSSPAELEQRFAEINTREPEELAAEEATALAEVKATNNGNSVSLNAFKAELKGYSEELVLRIPRSLHKHLEEEAEIEGVSLNQYMLYKLSR